MTRTQKSLAWLAVVAGFLWLISLFKAILAPFIAGAIVAYLLDPLVGRLERVKRIRFSRAAASGIVFLLALLAVLSLFMMAVPLVKSQLGILLEKLPVYSIRVYARLIEIFPAVQEEGAVKDFIASHMQEIARFGMNFLGKLLSNTSAVFDLVSFLALTPVVAFYLLKDWAPFERNVKALLPRPYAPVIQEKMTETDRILKQYLFGQASVCLILAAYYSTALSIAGIELGFLIGIISGLIVFIPYIGALTGFCLAMAFALLHTGGYGQVVSVCGIYLVGQIVESNFLTPTLVGEKIGLHPVWVIFALLAGGVLLGFTGVLLALPVAAVVGVAVRFCVALYQESPLYGGGTKVSDPPCS